MESLIPKAQAIYGRVGDGDYNARSPMLWVSPPTQVQDAGL